MQIQANFLKFVDVGNFTSSLENVAVMVDVDRVIRTSNHRGYAFGLTLESQIAIEKMAASGAIYEGWRQPSLYKKDYPKLRIPILESGQMSRIIDGKCGAPEKAIYLYESDFVQIKKDD